MGAENTQLKLSHEDPKMSAAIAGEPDILRSAATTEGPSASSRFSKSWNGYDERKLLWSRSCGREGEAACTSASAYARHALESHLDLMCRSETRSLKKRRHAMNPPRRERQRTSSKPNETSGCPTKTRCRIRYQQVGRPRVTEEQAATESVRGTWRTTRRGVAGTRRTP